MADSFGFLSAEGGTESVDVREGGCVVFDSKLSRNSQRSFSAEEIFGVIDFFFFFFKNGDGLEIIFFDHGGDLEHFSCSFAVRSSNDRSVNIVESVLLEELMGGHGQLRTHSSHRRNKVSSGSKMHKLAQVFHWQSDSSHRVLARIFVSTKNFD